MHPNIDDSLIEWAKFCISTLAPFFSNSLCNNRIASATDSARVGGSSNASTGRFLTFCDELMTCWRPATVDEVAVDLWVADDMAGVMDGDDMFVSRRSMFVRTRCWGAGMTQLLHPVGQEFVLAATWSVYGGILQSMGGILQFSN